MAEYLGRSGVPLPRSPLEAWFTEHPGPYGFSLAATAVGALGRGELKRWLPTGFDGLEDWTYGDPVGDSGLRGRIARTYGVSQNRVFLTHGAVEANFMALACLVRPGDELICQFPVYPQLPCVAEGMGARVLKWEMPPDGQPLDWQALDVMWGPRTRVVVVNFPHSPTGRALSDDDWLALAVRLAAWPDSYLLIDEVYQHVGVSAPDQMPYHGHPRVLVSNSVSKAWGLPGARLGWLLAPVDCLAAATVWREHLSLALASPSVALVNALWDQRGEILESNQALLTRNLAVVEALEWPGCVNRVMVARRTGTLLINCHGAFDDRHFARSLYHESHALVVPASTIGYPGCLRVGFGHRDIRQLEIGLAGLARALEAYT